MPVGQHRVIHVELENTTSKSGNQVVNRVVQASTILTTIKLDNPRNPVPVNIAVRGNTTTYQDNSIALFAPLDPPMRAPVTPTANHALPEEFSSTNKTSTVKFVHPVTIKTKPI